jgi:hypothetical protein
MNLSLAHNRSGSIGGEFEVIWCHFDYQNQKTSISRKTEITTINSGTIQQELQFIMPGLSFNGIKKKFHWVDFTVLWKAHYKKKWCSWIWNTIPSFLPFMKYQYSKNSCRRKKQVCKRVMCWFLPNGKAFIA